MINLLTNTMHLKTTIIILLFTSIFYAQKPAKVYKIEPKLNQIVTYSSNLNLGTEINDLSWAWKSSNACFAATEQNKFNGNHVFFTGIIPKNTNYKIKVIPKNKTVNISLYVYEIKVNNSYLVPNLPACIRCVSDSAKKIGTSIKKFESYIRNAENKTASNNPFRIIIGVVGANKLNKGAFSLEIQINQQKS